MTSALAHTTTAATVILIAVPALVVALWQWAARGTRR